MNEYSAIVTTVCIAAVTFIMQRALGNIFSGIALMFSRPFKKNDKVLVKYTNGSDIVSGRVVGMNIMHVKIKTYTRDICIIPTCQFDNLIIINSDLKDGVNHTQSIGISLDSNVDKATALIKANIMDNIMTDNTEENTQITCKVVGNHLLMTYNVRTFNVDTSFEVCTEITKHIVRDFVEAPDITVV